MHWPRVAFRKIRRGGLAGERPLSLSEGLQPWSEKSRRRRGRGDSDKLPRAKRGRLLFLGGGSRGGAPLKLGVRRTVLRRGRRSGVGPALAGVSRVLRGRYGRF